MQKHLNFNFNKREELLFLKIHSDKNESFRGLVSCPQGCHCVARTGLAAGVAELPASA